MSHLKKLNGWQRLWVVLACLWTIFSLVILGPDLKSAGNFDFYAELEKEKALLTIKAALILEENELEDRRRTDQYSYGDGHQFYLKKLLGADDILRNDYRGKSYGEVIKSFEDKYGKKIDSASVQKKAESNVSERIYENRKNLLLPAVGIWLIPIIFIYLAGLSVAWIFRGFRQ